MELEPLSKAWIRASTLRQLLTAYAGAGAKEPCGVLLGRIEDQAVRIVEAPQTPNTHSAPSRAFRVAPQDILRIARSGRAEGLTVVGFWHGHLASRPEPGEEDLEDLESAEELGPSARLMVIVGAGGGRAPVVRAYTRGQEGPKEIPLAT